MSTFSRQVKSRFLISAMLASFMVLAVAEKDPAYERSLRLASHDAAAPRVCDERKQVKVASGNDSVSVVSWLTGRHKAPNFHFIDVLELFR